VEAEAIGVEAEAVDETAASTSLVGTSTTAWEKGLVKRHVSVSQVLNAPTYYTTLAPNDALPDPHCCNQYKRNGNIQRSPHP